MASSAAIRTSFIPRCLRTQTPVLPPFGDPNYILIHDLADRSINWIRTQHAAAPDKPFLLYFAPGNSHAPHQATKDWIAKFKGQFDQGWDKVREDNVGATRSGSESSRPEPSSLRAPRTSPPGIR